MDINEILNFISTTEDLDALRRINSESAARYNDIGRTASRRAAANISVNDRIKIKDGALSGRGAVLGGYEGKVVKVMQKNIVITLDDGPFPYGSDEIRLPAAAVEVL